MELGDCTCRQLDIGNLHFPAIDDGDTIPIDEFAQQRLCALDVATAINAHFWNLRLDWRSKNTTQWIYLQGVA